MQEGRIVRAVSGYYYVLTTAGNVVQCRARGLFKLRGINPLVGDLVTFTTSGASDGVIEDVKPRSSELIRPPLANIEQVLLVFALSEPALAFYQLDKMIAMVERQRLPLALVLTKADIPGTAEIFAKANSIYAGIYPLLKLSVQESDGLEELGRLLANKISAFAGLSGVGKSTLLGKLVPEAQVMTGSVSKRSQRGRHTTRHVELFPYRGGFIADTPGFSQYSFADLEPTEVADLFRDLLAFSHHCEFRGCLHENEQGCAVRAAYQTGELPASRYESYRQLLEEVKVLKARRYS